MDFSESINTWIKVLTNPGTQVFEEERTKPRATIQTALIWLLIAAAVAAIFNAINALIFGSSATMSELPADMRPMVEMMAGPGSALMSFLVTLIFTPIVYLIWIGILHLVANLLGGKGDFGTFTYLLATFLAPTLILTGALSGVRVVGGCLGLIIGIYQLVLTFFATRVNYGLSQGRAIAVVLIPLVVVILFVFCMVFLAVGASIAA